MTERRPNSVASTEVVVRLPTEAVRAYKGRFSERRGATPDALGNRDEFKQPLAAICTRFLKKELNYTESAELQGDGSFSEASG